MTPKIHALTPEMAAKQASLFSLVFFVRLTLEDVWRITCQAPWGEKVLTFLRTLAGWRSNLTIRNGQFWAMLGHWRDGFQDFCHVAMVIQDPWETERTDFPAGTPMMIESTSPAGVQIKPLAERLRSYKGRTVIVPLALPPALEKVSPDTTKAPAEGWHSSPFNVWLKRAEGLGYDGVGLFGVLFNLGIDTPGAFFCSELIAEALTELGLLPEWIPRLRCGKLSNTEQRPNFFEVSELARLTPLLDWGNAVSVDSRRLRDGI